MLTDIDKSLHEGHILRSISFSSKGNVIVEAREMCRFVLIVGKEVVLDCQESVRRNADKR